MNCLFFIITSFFFFKNINIINTLDFIVLGDWGYRNDNQQKVAKAISHFIQNKDNGNSTFIISTGDNFYSYGVKSIYDEKWKYVYEEAFNQEGFKDKRWYIIAESIRCP